MGTLLGKLVFQLHFYYWPVFTKEVEVECYKVCCKRMGLYHFTEAREEPPTTCSSKVASRYNSFTTPFTIPYLPKLILG